MSDLAKGVGGDYRYLVPQVDVQIEKKLKRLALYRKSNSEGPVHESDIKDRGYTDFLTDINAGRGGDYLHLILEAGLWVCSKVYSLFSVLFVILYFRLVPIIKYSMISTLLEETWIIF